MIIHRTGMSVTRPILDVIWTLEVRVKLAVPINSRVMALCCPGCGEQTAAPAVYSGLCEYMMRGLSAGLRLYSIQESRGRGNEYKEIRLYLILGKQVGEEYGCHYNLPGNAAVSCIHQMVLLMVVGGSVCCFI